jgi:hypothetical protein
MLMMVGAVAIVLAGILITLVLNRESPYDEDTQIEITKSL